MKNSTGEGPRSPRSLSPFDVRRAEDVAIDEVMMAGSVTAMNVDVQRLSVRWAIGPDGVLRGPCHIRINGHDMHCVKRLVLEWDYDKLPIVKLDMFPDTGV